MPESQLAILTEQGHRAVWSMTGRNIPQGLAVTRVPLVSDWGDWQRAADSRYSITHIQSGKRVGPGFEERRDAQRVAEALGECADWTLPAFALLALPHIAETVSAVLDAALTQLEER